MEFVSKTFDELSTRELFEILRSRARIFVSEQKIVYTDPDDTDLECLHCFFCENSRVTAYLRAFRTDGFTVKIGRVLTLVHGMGLGSELMKKSIGSIRRRLPCRRIVLDAQKHAVGFYEKLGFKVVSDEYLEEGIVHVDMELILQ